MSIHHWRRIRYGFDRLEHASAPRHQHLTAYATIVLAGAYEQLSYAGRLRVEAGAVLIQPTLDAHLDRPGSRRLDIIRLPWTREPSLGGVYHGVDTRTIERVAMRDVREASQLLASALQGRSSTPPAVLEWEDQLAKDLTEAPDLRIARWAHTNHRTREYVWRRFRCEYGVGPKRFHGELRARAAWLALTGSRDNLSDIAARFGFADQSHMTRTIRALTGRAPIEWRRSFASQMISAITVL